MHLEHNHASNPDPFQYVQHQSKRPRHAKAIALAETYCRVISYKELAKILRKEGLEIE
jgi:hypothetical protein